MENIVIKEPIKIEDFIYEVRGKYVMLDSDLARFYNCANGTKSINLAVKRHLKRFPERFMFQLTKEEVKYLRFQFETTKKGLKSQAGNTNMSRALPYVFTEQGVAMLSAVLRTEVAEEISVKIMDAFVAMKKYISTGMIEQKYINNLVLKHEEGFDKIDKYLLSIKEDNNKIYFDGQRYDAYSFLLDIINKSKEEIIIIDNYIDKNLFDLLSKTKKDITIITNKYNNTDYEKYKSQYNNVSLVINNDIHDRFIIIDRKTLYHCGSSFKDLGNKCFGINKIEDHEYINSLINRYMI